MHKPLLTFLFFVTLQASGQLAEDFSDSNFTAAPAWTGTPGAWSINAQRQLQSAHTVANSSFYLSTPITLPAGSVWECWLRLAFATSSANYTDIWLLSANADPASAGNTGYFVRVGGTTDEISLYRKDANTTVRLIDGADGITDASDNRLRLRVIREPGGRFRLQRALEGAGWFTEGTALDTYYNGSGWLAIAVRQSTSSFFSKHFFDDIHVAPFVADTSAPLIQSVRARSDSTVELVFNEPVVPTDAAQPQHYSIASIGTAVAAIPDPANAARVTVRFGSQFPPRQRLLVTVRNIRDEWDNELLQDTGVFFWYEAARGDLVLHELMVDPDPPVGLPPVEWIELKNRSGLPVRLDGWRLRCGNSSTLLPDRELLPDSLILLTSPSAVPQLARYGSCIGVAGFTPLPNDGDTIVLEAPGGNTIDALAYDRSCYRDAVKDDGGWSLERIDDTAPCGDAGNWRASIDPSGGTPGRANSVANNQADDTEPAIVRTWCADSLTVVVRFSKPLDSAATARAGFRIAGGPSVLRAICLPPLFNLVQLSLDAPLASGRPYELVAEGVCDCSGNGRAAMIRGPVGLPALPASGQLRINELMYQPATGGPEWVELYNYGTTVLDLSRVYIATRNAAGTLSTPKRVVATPWLLFPSGYVVVTGDREALLYRHTEASPSLVVDVPGMPALPDEGGTVVVVDQQGAVLDEVHYDPDWQFALLSDTHGVSLERITAGAPSQDRHNWHSAAEAVGFSTPTARNSQTSETATEGMLTVSPAVFSPNGDGFDDLAFISYQLPESGWVASITLFDARGRPCSSLVRNSLLGRSGRWHWDGLSDQMRPLPAGVYIVFAELYNLEGKRRTVKKTVVLSR